MRFVLSEICHGNAELSGVGCTPQYDRERTFQQKLVTMFFAFIVIGVFLDIAVMYPAFDLQYLTVFTIRSVLKQSVYAQFYALAYVLNRRFMAVNEELVKLRTLVHKLEWMNVAERKLNILCKLHLKLQRMLNEVESYFPLTLLVFISVLLCRTSFHLAKLASVREFKNTDFQSDVLAYGHQLFNYVWLTNCLETSNSLQKEVCIIFVILIASSS